MSDGIWIRRLRSALVGLAACCALAACVVEPVGPGRVYVGPAIAPPPPLGGEVIGIAPAPGYVWSGGYWNWVGSRYVWVGGYWMRPRPGYYWVRPHWARGRGGWRFEPGHWRR
jgi:hypothetical protein